MAAPISSLGSPELVAPLERTTRPTGGAGGGGFADTLLDAVSQARAMESHATEQAGRFADGDPSVGIHEVVIASEEANVSVRFATTLKNKVLEAYRELMNTPV